MNYPINHGLEYELQLMVETIDGDLELIDINNYFNFMENYSAIFDSISKCISSDMGNIEIRTPPRNSYFEAVESANYLLIKKLIPTLINKLKLKKFALFLPTPMSQLIKIERSIYDSEGEFKKIEEYFFSDLKPVCFKHWNISYPSKYCQEASDLYISTMADFGDEIYQNCDYTDLFDKIKAKAIKNTKWKYDYQLLIKKGYIVDIKDFQYKSKSRVHIKIPYHYQPSEGNPNLMPKFEDTFIPPDKWRNLVCYYKNNVFVKVRDLI